MEIKENNIYLGDAYELIKDLPDKSVDLIITDPPYQIDGLHTGTGILKDRAKNLNFYVNQMMESKIAKDRLNGIDQNGKMNLFYEEEKYEQMNLFED